MSAITLKDIAEAAGVSVSTVSLVFSGKKRISKDVRDKVYAVSQKLGYIKPLYGSSIATNRLSHLAILVHEDYEKAFEWHFIRQMIIHLEAVLTKERYYPVIIPVRLDEEANAILENVGQAKVGGLFSIHYGNAELFQRLEEQGIPVVIINNSNFQNQFYSVCVDDFQGAYEGTRYLMAAGHQRIGYIEYHRPDVPAVVKDRFAGFKTALDTESLPFAETDHVTVTLFNMAELQQALGKLFATKDCPTALFVHDDHLAAQVIVTLRNMQIQVPQDVSIIAPGDTLDYNQVFIPQITTMRINTSLMGTLAGEMILKRLEHDQEDLHVLKVNQTLVERGSCQTRR